MTLTRTIPAALAGFCLFPCRAGTKTPVIKWKDGSTSDPAVIQGWIQEGHNLAVDCNKSGLIIIDVDASKVDRATAWKAYTDLCASWSSPVVPPTTQSARGGWHIPFRRPADLAATDLRGGGTLVKISDVRPLEPGEKDGEVIGFKNRGYCVAPGSYLSTPAGDLPYLAMPDAAPPQVAPPPLVELLKLPPIEHSQHPSSGDWDHAEVLSIVKHLHQVSHEYVTRGNQNRWKATLAVRNTGIPLSDELYEYLGYEHDEDSKFFTRWERQDRSDDRNFNMQSLKLAAIKSGWSERAQKSATQMFAGVIDPVAQIAANAGATLSSQAPIPLADTQRIIAALGQPVLDNFLAGTRDAPSRPMGGAIMLPEVLKDHPLFDLLNESIERILAMAEGGSKAFRQDRVLEVIGVLDAVHQETRETLCQRLRAMGAVISPGRPEEAAYRFECCVMAEIRTAAGFDVDTKGEPNPRNSDNLHVFFRLRKVKFRHNTLTDRTEISDSDRDDYQPLTDSIFDGLMVDAENGQYNFHPSKEAFRRGVNAAALRVPTFDPLRDIVDTLAGQWDGVGRLDTWLSFACGVPNDAYHVATGRNLIGGLVNRARRPGCPHAETVIFISPDQGTGKSTLCKILALNEKWYTDSFKLGGTQQNSLPQLASKWVVELGELAGMNKAEVEDIKQFMTINVDEYVKKYQAFPTEQPRRCVFIGTSNDRRPLADASGGRRFLPVHVQGEVNLAWMRENVEQLIGEAAVREAQGETFGIPREVWSAAADHQEAARSMTPVEELCREWFHRPPGSYYVTSTDILRGLEMAKQKGRYATFMDKMGWHADNLELPDTGRKCRVWLRHTNRRLAECIRLEPVQAQTNGRVEFRMTQAPGVSSSVGLPPLPPSRQ